MKIVFILITIFFISNLSAQCFFQKSKQANYWVDSVFNSLTEEERITQLMIIRAHSNLGVDHIENVANQIKKYNVGGLCFFQGGPVRQANLTNYYQSISKTPLLISIDAEWGLGMRLDSVINFPKPMMLGAINNSNIVYDVATAIGKQCNRMGIQLNFAPVVDINNNPNNPVINDRSFGENKIDVIEKSKQYTLGLQAQNVMACAKHFPGHGDVDVDSHLALPTISKSFEELNNLELEPFKSQIKNNVSTVMMAHLSIPAIDTTQYLPTSLSKNVVTNLLKNKLKFKGLIITDALEMKGVTKYFPSGEASALALIAGNDLLCLPEQIEESIVKIKDAILQNKLSKSDFEDKVKKVLLVKYNLRLYQFKNIETENLIADLNSETIKLRTKISELAITIVKQENKNIIPLTSITKPFDVLPKVACINIGNGTENLFSRRMKLEYDADNYYYSQTYLKNDTVKNLIEPQNGITISDTKIKYELVKNILDSCLKLKKYDAIIISVSNFNRRPANNFEIGDAAFYLIKNISNLNNCISFFFGNPYAIKNICNAKNVIACYDEDDITQGFAIDFLNGRINAKGKLPVTVCNN